MSKRFFQDLPLRKRFDELAQSESYTPLPGDWLIGIADIEGSSDLIEAGAYKTVNTIGVAVISAQLNTHKGRAFPYVFGGDGAVFAVPPEDAERAREALGAVSCWAREEFDITLRIASATVAEIRAGGKEVSIARYHVSKDADYSMFSGGGVSWLEEEMKSGRFRLPGPARHTPRSHRAFLPLAADALALWPYPLPRRPAGTRRGPSGRGQCLPGDYRAGRAA